MFFLVIISALGTVFSIANMAESKSTLAAVGWAIVSTSYLLVTLELLLNLLLRG